LFFGVFNGQRYNHLFILNSLNCAWDGNPVYSAYVKKDRPNLHDKKEKVKANLRVILLILDCIKR